MGWRTHQLNLAFSAYEFFDDSNLGRCPRLQMNRAFGAKHVPDRRRTVAAVSDRRRNGRVANCFGGQRPPLQLLGCFRDWLAGMLFADLFLDFTAPLPR